MFLICGLGNPGKEFSNTRHNIGFNLIDKLSNFYNFLPFKKDTKKEVLKGDINHQSCLLMKPLNFMNLSGQPIQEIVNFYKIDKKKIYIIHDDLDLEFSDIRTKFDGGSAGHNGIKNIIQHIGDDFTRIRVGIGHPRNINDNYSVTNYVLGNFSKEEKKALPDIYLEIQKIIVNLLSQTSDK